MSNLDSLMEMAEDGLLSFEQTMGIRDDVFVFRMPRQSYLKITCDRRNDLVRFLLLTKTDWKYLTPEQFLGRILDRDVKRKFLFHLDVFT